MAEYIIDGALLTAIADAIREKTESTEPITPEDMVDEVAACYEYGYTKGGDDANALYAAHIERRETTLHLPPGVTRIGYSVFRNSSLSGVVVLPDTVTTLETEAFDGSKQITEFYGEGVENFSGAYELQYLTSATKISLPKLTATQSYSIAGCSKLTDLYLPKCARLRRGSLRMNPALVKLDLPVCSQIDEEVFHKDSSLTTLILRYNGVCTLASSEAFTDTPFVSGTGFVYVPDNLVEQYKIADGWSTYANQIKPISELEG